jgi:formamidopyrimidine-DNA glycosylase
VAGDAERAGPLAELGPEADALDAAGLAAALAGDAGAAGGRAGTAGGRAGTAGGRRLHTVLRDQRVLAGLGRRLANEVCHAARRSPFAPVGRLSDDDVAGLVAALAEVLGRELAAERSSDDMRAAAERDTAVHGRTGEPCPVCGDEIREVRYRDYTVHYCAACQTGGKVLADNTTSKFLR